jgi:hypothetical protein
MLKPTTPQCPRLKIKHNRAGGTSLALLIRLSSPDSMIPPGIPAVS